MPFVTEMTSQELRAHLRRREKEWIVGLTDPLVLRLWEELKTADMRIEELEEKNAKGLG